MGAVNLPQNIQNDTAGDADQVMANFQAITQQFNGNTEMGANVRASAPDAPITGHDVEEGSSVSGLRSDAQFIVQGVENATSLPTTGNFLGRLVYITAGVNIGKLFQCTDPTGSGSWIAFGNQAATDLAIHAAQHADGQHDPMPDNFLTDHMKAGRTVYSVVAGTVGPLLDTTWTTIVDLAITSVGLQTFHIIAQLKAANSGGDGSRKVQVGLRLVDVTAANLVIPGARSGTHQLGVTGGGADAALIALSRFYTVPVTGARTLRLQAAAAAGAGTGSTSIVSFPANGSFAGDTEGYAALQAVVV